jgi:hypothetical protein
MNTKNPSGPSLVTSVHAIRTALAAPCSSNGRGGLKERFGNEFLHYEEVVLAMLGMSDAHLAHPDVRQGINEQCWTGYAFLQCVVELNVGFEARTLVGE